jgi:putative transposase
MTVNFSRRHFLQALRYYLAYKLSYREIEEIFSERNIHFYHSTLNGGLLINFGEMVRQIARIGLVRWSADFSLDYVMQNIA